MSKGDAEQWIEPVIDYDTLAILQYTSGSTSTPKGVMVSHGNVLNNCQMLVDALKPTRETLGLSWLPLFHDMGLIGGALTPILVGFPIILMNFESFLMRPLRWLQAISRHRVSWSVGPNFAYDQCVKKVTAAQREELDLSSWQVALIGAETVRNNTLEDFSNTFDNNGFNLKAFYPCYGLAEATLFVTGGAHDAAPKFFHPGTSSSTDNSSVSTTATLVSCGWPRLQEKVMIVDTVTSIPCPPGIVGEIWVTGPNIAMGYWQKPEATQTTFRATIAGDDCQYLRTGDLGFQLDNELYVTGRIKNMMVVAGRNIHLEDVEHTVIYSQSEFQVGGCAAFCIDKNLDQLLVLIVEIDRAVIKDMRQNKTAEEALAFADGLQKSISTAVVQQHETAIHDIVFVRTGEISKTSSGKTQHYICREQYLAGKLVSAAFG
jgi:acyl-CoA synthetase (AMP-forming)/AMP-acid ligase II